MFEITDISFSIPPRAGKIVSMCQYQDRVLVACEYGIYELVDDGYKGYRMSEHLVTRINELEKGK